MKGVTLLSGGLDSVTSMLLARQEMDICLAITLDYGQRARNHEIQVSTRLCQRHNIKHCIIELPFMYDLQSGLIKGSGMDLDNPWVPNRNGLFINLAATFAENLGAEYVICGFNAEEAVDFPDNSVEYADALNQALYYSTLNHVKVISYVQRMNKTEIIKAALSLGIDLNSLWSCYEDGMLPCGKCPSCIRTKEAFEKAGIDYGKDFIY
ncbi:MAG: 7-cyano-7-deazaguanine synthase QueC [Syntrophomonadaceae bacterium]|nr:7-cyano-7-deazaguanine synthase QueC [Syntrophomonadaceae bacterium]